MAEKDKETRNKIAPFLIFGTMVAGISALIYVLSAKMAEPGEPPDEGESVRVWLGIYDRNAPKHIEGTLSFDGQPVNIPDGGITYVDALVGERALGLVDIAPGYTFLNWEIKDQESLEVILESAQHNISLYVDRRLFVEALVTPL